MRHRTKSHHKYSVTENCSIVRRVLPAQHYRRRVKDCFKVSLPRADSFSSEQVLLVWSNYGVSSLERVVWNLHFLSFRMQPLVVCCVEWTITSSWHAYPRALILFHRHFRTPVEPFGHRYLLTLKLYWSDDKMHLYWVK